MTEKAIRTEPDMQGWLLKWTNYVKGYQRRWFVLSNGLLSYYRLVKFKDKLYFPLTFLLSLVNLIRREKRSEAITQLIFCAFILRAIRKI